MNRESPQAPGATARGGRSMRLRGIVRKEFLQIMRDPSSISIAFLLPVLLLLIFGFGVSLDARHIPVALVIEQPSADAADFTGGFYRSPYFAPRPMNSFNAAQQALAARDVKAIVYLQNDFAQRLQQDGDAPIQLIVNGVDANTARLITGYLQGLWIKWITQRAERRQEVLQVPVTMVERVWFNSEVKSRNFLVPGLIAVVMTLIGALLTAMVIAREWERGTMEALMVTPIAMGEILLGKLLPYFVLGAGGMALSVFMAVWVFHVPLRGAMWLLFLAGSLFLLVALGMGLLISTIARSQFVAGQVAIVVTFLPAFILSGFIFDIESMPPFLQAVTHLIPARYFVSILQSIFLAGNIWSVMVPNMLGLLIMALVFIGLSRRKSRKRLD
ncbi:MAG: ABC transporter permease [Gammaproteobacteria bacterium]